MYKTKQPLISIIVPVFNTEEYLPKCIESILAQTYTNLEVLLINDGSTDLSGTIIDHYAAQDDRIKVIHQINHGLSAVRNIGLRAASGTLIGFVDSDDWIMADMYTSLYSDLITYDADIAVCGFIRVNKGDNPMLEITKETQRLYDDKQNIMHYAFNSANLLWSMLYKKHVFNEIQFPEGMIFEDLHTMHLILENADKVVVNPDPKYYYLQRSDSLSKAVSLTGLQDLFDAHAKRCKFVFEKYPKLLATAVDGLYQTLLLFFKIVMRRGKLEENRGYLSAMIDDIKKYSFIPIPAKLSPEEKRVVKMLIAGLWKFKGQIGVDKAF